MKRLADFGVDEVFLTQGQAKASLFHPRVLDNDLEEFMVVKEKVTTLNATGFKPHAAYTAIEEFKQLAENFEQHDYEVLISHNRKVKDQDREAARLQRQRLEQHRLEHEALCMHKNIKLLEKLTVPEPGGDYYDRMPIKPGFDFFNCLIRCPRRPLSTLAVNIPNSLYFREKIFHIYNSPDGSLLCTDEISYYTYYQQINSTHHRGQQPFDNVAAVLRMRGESYSDISKQVLDWTLFEAKINNHDLNPMSMLQQYIRCPGGRPGVVRLYYYCFGNDSKANFALFINSLALNSFSATQSEELSKCVVNTQKPQFLEAFKQSGAALKPYEAEAAKIVKFLNAGYNLRITEVVFDFIRDEQGKIWLSGCKRIILDDSSLRAALKPKKMAFEEASIEEDAGPAEQKERFKSCGKAYAVRCKLCRLVYPNFELNSLVSLHMLIAYKQHAAKRRDLPWDTSHLKFATKDQLSQCVRVCQYCYLLLTTELDLIEVRYTQTEHALALKLGITKRGQSLTEDPRLAMQLQFLPKQLLQWRVLCLFETLTDSRLKKLSGLYLAYKFSDHLTFFPLGEDCIDKPLNFMKVSYFYLQTQRTPRLLFDTHHTEIRVTKGPEWSQWVAKSSFALFKDLPADLPNGLAMVQTMQTVLFNRRQEPIVSLRVKGGVSADYPLNSKNIKSLMYKQSDVYIPEPDYCTTDPLPPAWMELFEYCSDLSSVDQDIERDIYVPTLSQAELHRMEDMTSPLKKLKRLSVDPNAIPVHRCCNHNDTQQQPTSPRKKRPLPKVVVGMPTLTLRGMKETTGTEVKRLHSSEKADRTHRSVFETIKSRYKFNEYYTQG